MNITTLLDQYIEYQQYFRNLAPTSLKATRKIVRYLREWTGVVEIAEVSDTVVRSFLKIGISDHKWSPRTLLTKMYTLSPFLRWCVSEGYLPHNPIDRIPRPKIQQPLPRKLTKQQAKKILDASYNMPYRREMLRSRNRAMLAVCLYAGLRKAELLTLQFTDIDILNKTIHVRNGKGGKDRLVPMSKTLCTILREYIHERHKLDVQVPHLFCNATGKREVLYGAFSKHLIKISAWSRVRFTLHTLRHTCATLLMDATNDINCVSKLLGHSRIETTTIYIRTSVEQLRPMINKHPLN